MTRTLLAGALVITALLTAGHAQVCETNCTAVVGQPVVVFTESDPNASGYLILRNGLVEAVPMGLVNGLVEFAYPSGLSVGTHVFLIQILDVDETYPNTLTVKAVPQTQGGCLTNGITYAAGSVLTQSMLQRFVSGYLNARMAEGWALRSTAKVRNLTTVTLTCVGVQR